MPTAKGYFLKILRDLKVSGYRVVCRVCDAQWLGVPQQRQRTIFVGVREDLNIDPVHPKPLWYRYSVRDALPWIGKVVHDTSGLFGAGDVTNRPSPAITIGVNSVNSNHFKVEAETDISRFAIGKEWDKLGPGESSDKYPSLVKPSPTIQACHGNLSTAGVTHPTEKRKFTIAELKRICAFPDDFILTGSYAQQWERLGNSVPPVMMHYIAAEIRNEILNPLRKNTVYRKKKSMLT